jgi:hypothetical protein
MKEGLGTQAPHTIIIPTAWNNIQGNSELMVQKENNCDCCNEFIPPIQI